MNESTHTDTTAGRVEALLNYLDVTAEKPVTFMYKTENGTPQRSYQNVKHTMAILNGRAVNEHLTLDDQGFALVRHPTAIADFYNEAEVRAVRTDSPLERRVFELAVPRRIYSHAKKAAGRRGFWRWGKALRGRRVPPH